MKRVGKGSMHFFIPTQIKSELPFYLTVIYFQAQLIAFRLFSVEERGECISIAPTDSGSDLLKAMNVLATQI